MKLDVQLPVKKYFKGVLPFSQQSNKHMLQKYPSPLSGERRPEDPIWTTAAEETSEITSSKTSCLRSFPRCCPSLLHTLPAQRWC